MPQLVTHSVEGNLPGLDELIDDFVEYMADEGLDVRITSTYRTRAEQAALWAQGRTKPGPIVTNAKPGQSKHELGRAFDFTFRELGYTAPDEWWDFAGEVGESVGLVWGGRWRHPDRPHFELADTPFDQA